MGQDFAGKSCNNQQWVKGITYPAGKVRLNIRVVPQ